MPYRDDNEALRAHLQNVISEKEKLIAKNKQLLEKLREGRAGVKAGLALIFTGVFCGYIVTSWLYARRVSDCKTTEKCQTAQQFGTGPLHQPHPGNFSPYSALVDEKDFYQKLMKTDYNAGLVWETAIKHAEIDKERLLFVGEGSYSQAISPIVVKAPSHDEDGVERYLLVGQKFEHPYGSYKVEPRLVFYAFGGGPRYGIRMKINPGGTEDFEVLAGNPMADYWKPMRKEEVFIGYKEKELTYWANTLRLK